MTEAKPCTIRRYRPGDEEGILRTFNLVFREVCGPDFVDRGMDFWRWQFADNPEGHRITVAVAGDGTVAAQYAGVPYRMATSFGECIFVHIVDSFVHPGYRKGLKRPGLFVQTALPWFELCWEMGDAVMYGYPVPIADRIGRRYLEYRPLRVVDFLCRELSEAATERPPAVSVAPVGAFGADADELFAAVAREKRCLTRRGADYLGWRYVQVPGEAYERFEARRDGALCGVLVLRPVHELVAGACTIADWVVAEDDAETRDALLAVATERGRAHGRTTLMAVFADPSPEHAALRAAGFSVVPSARTLERRLTHRIYHPEMTTEWLEEHWWYTLGDSDLV